MRRIHMIVPAAAIALAMAGCVPVTETGSPPSELEEPAQAQESDSLEPSFAPTPEEPEILSEVVAFGDAVTYLDGISVSVSVPVEFTPSEFSITDTTHPHNVMFNITLTNGSDDVMEAWAYGSMTSGGARASTVWDDAYELGAAPEGVLLPGQTITYKEAWNVADPANLVYEISVGFDYADAIFTNTVE